VRQRAEEADPLSEAEVLCLGLQLRAIGASADEGKCRLRNVGQGVDREPLAFSTDQGPGRDDQRASDPERALRRILVRRPESIPVDSRIMNADVGRHSDPLHLLLQCLAHREQPVGFATGAADLAGNRRAAAPVVDVASPCLDRHGNAELPTQPNGGRPVRPEEFGIDHVEREGGAKLDEQGKQGTRERLGGEALAQDWNDWEMRTEHIEALPDLPSGQPTARRIMRMARQRAGREAERCDHLQTDVGQGSEAERLPLDKATEDGLRRIGEKGRQGEHPKHCAAIAQPRFSAH